MPANAAPMPEKPQMPKHCRKLMMPNAPPMMAPPNGPMAMAAMATGIMLKVMDRPAGCGMFT